MADFDFSKLSISDVLDVNETDRSASRFYLAAVAAVGVDLGEISEADFVRIVSITRKCHGKWQGSDERRSELAAAEKAREEKTRVDRLARLAEKRDSILAAEEKARKAAAKRAEALAELREAGLLDS